ncbi:hypothetical protein GCM10022259_10410 [Aquimarina mytili]
MAFRQNRSFWNERRFRTIKNVTLCTLEVLILKNIRDDTNRMVYFFPDTTGNSFSRNLEIIY